MAFRALCASAYAVEGYRSKIAWNLAASGESGRVGNRSSKARTRWAYWTGPTSRAQLLDRARRLALRVSLRARPGSRPEPGPDGVRLYALVLMTGAVKAELVAHVRRPARHCGARRARASLPPVRDVRQGGIF